MISRILYVLCLLALVITPIVFLFTDHNQYDAIRAFVLVQSIITILLYSHGIIKSTVKWYKEKVFPDESARDINIGTIYRHLAIIVLLVSQTIEVLDRFGNEHLNYKTPVLQFCLIFLLFAWHKIDRKTYVPSVAKPFLDGALENDINRA